MTRNHTKKLIHLSAIALLFLLTLTGFGATKTFAAGQKPGPNEAPAAKQSPDAAGSNADAALNTSDASCVLSFSDVHTTDWFYQQVSSLACSGVISGYGDGTFRPYNAVTRGQVAKLVVKALNWPLLNPASARFNDVPVGSVYFQYVETAAARGLISGYGDGSFRVGALVTRGQLSKIVVLAEGWQVCATCATTFNDVSASNPFFGFIATAASNHIINGYSDNSFRPGASATRAQFSSILAAAMSAPPTTTSSLSNEEQSTIDQINSRRAALGLGTLSVNTALVTAARRQSDDIGPLGLCQHNGTDNSSPWQRVADAGYTGSPLGEVIGCGYVTPTDVVNGWWASSAHHDILTDPNATEIGCGWWISQPDSGAWQTCVTGKR